ncbi:FAD-binding oxidoreductase [Hydrogenophaga sp. SL48]|uniref:FAD-binding oxidoreductase n=1 Tax=Hydrogenophaga sp. SL48 TaxID=2806347 RepID=UPI001F1A5516|nr:FAD-binding oxidoreductase [Hydrogenophaga sp. SL48]UJW83081.1 FAD-binding oxidoreductase [Hydrogenophaga sp. SL48]
MTDLVAALRALVGDAHVLTLPDDMAAYNTDWRRKYLGRARAVVRPGSTAEVAAVMALAHDRGVAVVPQGGNTGLSGGATPDAYGQQLVLNLCRLNRIRHIDAANDTVVVEAGVTLQALQDAARGAGRLFPLSLAAQGSCTVGGNLATNAGGTAVLRYGNMRELTLGLEVVTPDGQVWNGLRALRKDNTGYDLKQLYIGSEGSLGVITAAALKLFAPPRATLTAMMALPSLTDAVTLLTQARLALGPALTAFEVISNACVPLLARHFPALRWPFATNHPLAVLLEVSDHHGEAGARDALERVLGLAMDVGTVVDGVVAESLSQSRQLWALREHISEAQGLDGPHIKHDISLPASHVATFVGDAEALVARAAPGARVAWFGHLGDGNLHFNVLAPPGSDAAAFAERQPEINRLVHDQVVAFQGSISAEHGLGQLRRDENARYKSELELALMQAVKQALDPLGLMNPGKVISPQ